MLVFRLPLEKSLENGVTNAFTGILVAIHAHFRFDRILVAGVVENHSK